MKYFFCMFCPGYQIYVSSAGILQTTLRPYLKIHQSKVLMQGKLFQRCTHFLYCSVLSFGGKVNAKWMSQPDMESIFTQIIYEIFWSLEIII